MRILHCLGHGSELVQCEINLEFTRPLSDQNEVALIVAPAWMRGNAYGR